MKLAIISTLLSALAIGGNALPLDSSDLATNADYSVGLDLFSDGDCKVSTNDSLGHGISFNNKLHRTKSTLSKSVHSPAT